MAKGRAIKAAERVHALLKEQGLKLALAESCTGGYIGHLITSVAGASEVFTSSTVAYSPSAKRDLLGLKDDDLNEGTISPICAEAMARGALKASDEAQIALSITGNLGPDPIENKSVGLIYMALCHGRHCKVRELSLEGTRDEIKQKAAIEALEFLCGELTSWA